MLIYLKHFPILLQLNCLYDVRYNSALLKSLQTNPHDGLLRVAEYRYCFGDGNMADDEFWSPFDKKANFSWSKQALPFISRLVYWLKMGL